MQISQAIINNLNENSSKNNFLTDEGAREELYLSFYERNSAGRGIDFTENPDAKEDCIRYAINLHDLNPLVDTRKTPVPPPPPPEDLA